MQREKTLTYAVPKGHDPKMTFRRLVPIAVLLFAGLPCLLGCGEQLPSKAPPLSPEAQNVEIISDVPNTEIYEPAGEVSAKIIGRDNTVSLREAFNMLRNQAAARGATFVAVDEISSTAAWDLSGRTVVTLVGTAYRTK